MKKIKALFGQNGVLQKLEKTEMKETEVPYITDAMSDVTNTDGMSDTPNLVDEQLTWEVESGQKDIQEMKKNLTVIEEGETSDGFDARYYDVPKGAIEIQDLISYKNMNAQIGEMFRTLYRYGECSHSDAIRELNKIKFYCDAEMKRLEMYDK